MESIFDFGLYCFQIVAITVHHGMSVKGSCLPLILNSFWNMDCSNVWNNDYVGV